MCRLEARIASGGAGAAIIFELCADRADLATKLAEDSDIVSPKDFATNEVFQACANAASAATHALVELNYFDLDYRSNLTLSVGARHSFASHRTDRLIFLNMDTPKYGNLAEVLSTLDAAKALGYVVLTPERTIGRSLIPPPATLECVDSKANVPGHVRTSVHEQITIFGRRTTVAGVPFIQQDGAILSCSHAAAWMAHYAAVMRGIATRRPTGRFHIEAAAAGASTRRHYPSTGITPTELAVALENFGMPVESFTIIDLDKGGRWPSWHDRGAIHDLSDELVGFVAEAQLPAADDDGKPAFKDVLLELDRRARYELDEDECAEPERAARALSDAAGDFWIRETLTRTVCQYLNSGFPSLILTDHHARVIVGYLRRKDMEESFHTTIPHDDHESDGDVVAFIVSNDVRGPYIIRSVDKVLDSFKREDSIATLVVPLPSDVWLSALDVEDLGATGFAGAVANAAKSIEGFLDGSEPQGIKSHVNDDSLLKVREQLTELSTTLASGRTDYALRSYIVPGSAFKAGFAERRHDDPIAVSQVRVVSLPKFVWVVEIMVRSVRHDLKPSVIGEVVLDATDTDIEEVNAVVVHIPGAVQVRGSRGAGRWHVTGISELYASGRYHQDPDWKSDPASVASQVKTTIS